MTMAKFISPAELADMLGISIDTVYREHRAWGLRSVRIGRQIRFSVAEVEKWLARQADAA